VCNPCGGYGYTASEANAQGYTPGEVCNSCGTMKYKRSANACDGFKECTCGGESGATVCYSGTVKKYSSCKSCCSYYESWNGYECVFSGYMTACCGMGCGSECNAGWSCDNIEETCKTLGGSSIRLSYCQNSPGNSAAIVFCE